MTLWYTGYQYVFLLCSRRLNFIMHLQKDMSDKYIYFFCLHKTANKNISMFLLLQWVYITQKSSLTFFFSHTFSPPYCTIHNTIHQKLAFIHHSWQGTYTYVEIHLCYVSSLHSWNSFIILLKCCDKHFILFLLPMWFFKKIFFSLTDDVDQITRVWDSFWQITYLTIDSTQT